MKTQTWLVVFCLLLCGGAGSRGQGALAPTLLTMVATDPVGAMVPGASVYLKNVETGTSYSLRTDGSGRCVQALDPGRYNVAVQASGFAPLVLQNRLFASSMTLQLPLVFEATGVQMVAPQMVIDPTADGRVPTPQTDFVRVGVNGVLGPMGYVASPAMTGTTQMAGANSEAVLASRNYNFPSIILYISSSPLVYAPTTLGNKANLDKIQSAQETNANPIWLDASFTLMPKDAQGNPLASACRDGSVQVLGILPQQTAASTRNSGAVDAMTAANDAAGALASFYPGASAAASSATKALNVVFGDIFPPKPIAFQYSYLSGNCDFGWFFRPNLNPSTGTAGAASILGLQTGIILLKTTRDIAQIQVVGRTLSEWSKAPSTYSKKLFTSSDTLPTFVLPAAKNINFDELSDLSAFPAMIAKAQAMAITHVANDAEWETLVKAAPLVTTPSGAYVTNASLSAFLTAKAPAAATPPAAGGKGSGTTVVTKPDGGKGSSPAVIGKPVRPAKSSAAP